MSDNTAPTTREQLLSRLAAVENSSDLENWAEARLAINDARMHILRFVPVLGAVTGTPEPSIDYKRGYDDGFEDGSTGRQTSHYRVGGEANQS